MGGVLIATAERIGNPLECLDTRVFKRVSKSAIALFPNWWSNKHDELNRGQARRPRPFPTPATGGTGDRSNKADGSVAIAVSRHRFPVPQPERSHRGVIGT